MLLRNLMIRANDRTLEQRPYALNRVRVSLAAHIFAQVMIDCFVARVLIFNSVIGRPRISHNAFGRIIKAGFDEVMKRATIIRLLNLETNAAAALNRSENHCLANCAATLNNFLSTASVHVLSLAAYVRFVNLYNLFEKRCVSIRDSRAYTVAEIPCGFVGHAKRALELQSRHTFFSFAHQIDGQKPFSQRQVRVVKDSVNFDGELIAASITGEQAALVHARKLLRLATKTLYSVRPAKMFKVYATGFFIAEPLHQSG